jgi:hypothetical protein
VRLTRRKFVQGTAALGLAPFVPLRDRPPIESVEPAGVLVRECSLPGETRADDVVPAHPNGIPVSRDRWLLVYATRGFRGVDDDLSIVYQLRRGGPDGTVIREGFLARTTNAWDALGDGRTYVRQHGHPVVFGVPKGARAAGRALPHANLFVAKWRVCARVLDPATGELVHARATEEIRARTQGVEWAQFRLNAAEDDLEIVKPAGPMCQKGFESGPRFCSADGVGPMNQSFTPPVPLARDGSAWADCNAFDGGRVAPLRYAYSSDRGLYEWVQTGPLLSGPGVGIFEAGLAPWGAGFVMSARLQAGSGVAWARMEDPFGRAPEVTAARAPDTNSPLTLFRCADGVLRLLTGEKGRRDPLYVWDVDPAEGFAVSNRRVVFDSVKAGLPIRPAAQPKVDMGKVLPAQGRTQLVVHRVSVRSFNRPYPNRPSIPVINKKEKEACGIYATRITFRDALPPPWEFE